jgi:hypothetical protein
MSDTNQTNLFHNTGGLSGSELENATVRAGHQNTHVAIYFKEHSDDEFITPEKVHEYLKEKIPEKYRNAPLTSIRRAFNYLKRPPNCIIEENGKRMGHYGMKVTAYKLSKNEQQSGGK